MLLAPDLRDWLDAGHPARWVERGQPAPVLLDAAKDADLILVGSHGHGRFAGMLMGSVSTHCVEHASCPVVVVRGEAEFAAGDG